MPPGNEGEEGTEKSTMPLLVPANSGASTSARAPVQVASQTNLTVPRTSVPTYDDWISYSPAPKVDELLSDSERLGYS